MLIEFDEEVQASENDGQFYRFWLIGNLCMWQRTSRFRSFVWLHRVWRV